MADTPFPGEEKVLLDGHAFRRALEGGYAALERHYEAVNALNVYPVPDGDTGINMLLTMKAGLEAAPEGEGHLGRVAGAVAHGALLGARGNAGVILSQFLRGVGIALRDVEEADGHLLALALRRGTELAYRSVAQPVEGTILTVMRAAAEAVEAHKGQGLHRALQGGVEAAKDALARTPNLLPVLAEAGVVDAGGQGFLLLLEGALYALRGEDVARIPDLVTAPSGKVSALFLQRTAAQRYGFCTNFVIRGQDLDVDAIRAALSSLAHSTVVMGDATMVRVHLHTLNPQEALAHALRFGQVEAIEVQDMDRMHQELLEAIEAVPAEEVILLPNNPNIIVSGQQAVGLAGKKVHLLPTRSIPQGIAALLAFNPEASVRENLQRMAEALQGVRVGEVVASTRTTRVDGRDVREGDLMGFLDGALVVAGEGLEETVCRLVEAALPLPQGLVSLYWGHQETQASADALAQALRRRFPHLQVEALLGGQPFYPVILSME
jgi:dihydroxyacetone kinase-like predicted kinase